MGRQVRPVRPGEHERPRRMRVLRDDPTTGENSYITATIPFRHGVRAERHPVVQEFFVLAGELNGNTGTMQAGAYCFRPEMVAHGPYGYPDRRADHLPLARWRSGDVLGGCAALRPSRRRMRLSFHPGWPHHGELRCRVRHATEPGVHQTGWPRRRRPAAARRGIGASERRRPVAQIRRRCRRSR